MKLPPLWYSSWFGWVQYNGSISAADGAECRASRWGCGRRSTLPIRDKLFQSTVDVKNLWGIEQMLGWAHRRFAGLKAPVWPAEVFGSNRPGEGAAGGGSLQGAVPELPYAGAEVARAAGGAVLGGRAERPAST